MFPMFSLFTFLVGRWTFDPAVLKEAEEKAAAPRSEERKSFSQNSNDLKRLEGPAKIELRAAPAIACQDAKTADYLNGLANRADLLYGKTDPEFVQEYRDYLTMSANSLGDKCPDLASLQGQIRSPEDYRAKGFLNLPPRPENALSGSEFVEQVLGVDLEEYKKNPRQLGTLSKIERENAILEQIELGNVPEFMRRPKALTIKGPDGGEVKTYVMPDCIAIGSNEDFVRVPMSPILAQALARKYDWCLPTKTIVEEAYQQAGKRLVGPSYTGPKEFKANSAYLDSSGFYLRSNEDIQAQLKDVPLGTLVAGGKKELVISPQVAVRFAGGKAGEAIDFYGLYDAEGIPIQRTPGHQSEAGYRHTEYALGVRFVSQVLVVTKKSGERVVMRMDQALQDPEIAKIFSRVERTEDQKKFRSPVLDGPFDPNTVYQQKPVKGQELPETIGA